MRAWVNKYISFDRAFIHGVRGHDLNQLKRSEAKLGIQISRSIAFLSPRISHWLWSCPRKQPRRAPVNTRVSFIHWRVPRLLLATTTTIEKNSRHGRPISCVLVGSRNSISSHRWQFIVWTRKILLRLHSWIWKLNIHKQRRGVKIASTQWIVSLRQHGHDQNTTKNHDSIHSTTRNDLTWLGDFLRTVSKSSRSWWTWHQQINNIQSHTHASTNPKSREPVSFVERARLDVAHSRRTRDYQTITTRAHCGANANGAQTQKRKVHDLYLDAWGGVGRRHCHTNGSTKDLCPKRSLTTWKLSPQTNEGLSNYNHSRPLIMEAFKWWGSTGKKGWCLAHVCMAGGRGPWPDGRDPKNLLNSCLVLASWVKQAMLVDQF